MDYIVSFFNFTNCGIAEDIPYCCIEHGGPVHHVCEAGANPEADVRPWAFLSQLSSEVVVLILRNVVEAWCLQGAWGQCLPRQSLNALKPADHGGSVASTLKSRRSHFLLQVLMHKYCRRLGSVY